jgi:hypothetical protein
MGATNDPSPFSDDEIEALLRAAAVDARLDEADGVVELIIDIRTEFASAQPIAGAELIAWLNDARDSHRDLDCRPALQGQLVDLNEIIDRLLSR